MTFTANVDVRILLGECIKSLPGIAGENAKESATRPQWTDQHTWRTRGPPGRPIIDTTYLITLTVIMMKMILMGFWLSRLAAARNVTSRLCCIIDCIMDTIQNPSLQWFLARDTFTKRIVVMLVRLSVCPFARLSVWDGRALYFSYFGADLSLWLDRQMFWAPWH